MFVSSTGFSIDFHYCQGQVKSFSLIGKAKSCHEQAEKNHCKKKLKACHADQSNSKKIKQCKKDCCSNKTIKFETNDNVKTVSYTHLTLPTTPYV